MSQPRIVVTMGDPGGIGPEVALKALESLSMKRAVPFIVGDVGLLRKEARRYGIQKKIIAIRDPERLPVSYDNTIPVFTVSNLGGVRHANPDITAARATIAYLDAAHDLIMRGYASAVATAPITKKALKRVGFAFPGHTEYFASLTGTTDFAMMLAGSRLRVVLATIHIPLIDVFTLLTTELIVAKGRLIDRWFTRFLGFKPRIGIPGLNPHASENGLFGDEERRIIIPAVKTLLREGINARGPYPPDTIYHAAYHGGYDVILSMYHDQGLIPLKLVHFEDGINVTLGLPYVRSSVDHGSGYDIAGKGCANPASMIAAIRFAARVSVR